MQSDGDEGVLVDLAIKAIEMLAAVKPAAARGCHQTGTVERG